MINKFQNIDTNNSTYYFFNGRINIKYFDPNKINIDEKSNEIIFVYLIRYGKIKELNYIKIPYY